ncbi:MAG TPA: multidrug effflux MFS transporter [Solirubrobacteraceae bacterium]|jgi:DHA1 family bicyclomycin/chloramphenicol resistance-like MFS transporter
MRSDPPAGRVPLTLVLILGALSAFAPLSLDMYLPGLPQLGRDLGASASAAQLTLTSCLAGLALGQVIAGPLSDRFGRRSPVLAGVALYVVASVLCALAPSVALLLPLRFVQGLAGAAGIVISRAVVRDLTTGEAAARLFAALMVVNGAAPILAPVIGGQLLGFTTWRTIFLVLAGVGAALLVAAAAGLPESLPAQRRRPAGLGPMAAALREVARDRGFVAHALAGGLVLGAMFAYIAGSPFVLQGIYGLSPQAFSAVFAANGLGIVLASMLTGRLVRRLAVAAILRIGIAASIAGSAVVLAGVLAPAFGVAPVLVGLFLVVASVGLVVPTTTTLALADHGAVAGSASALLGVLQYLLGALTAPLVGAAGAGTALPMAVLMLGLSAGAAAVLRLRRSG